MSFPTTRLRRNRIKPWIRNLTQENHLRPQDLILPLFICDGQNIKEEIPNFPSSYRLSVDEAIKICKAAYEKKIQSVMIFPVIDPKYKTQDANYAIDPENFIYQAINKIKNAVPELGIIADIALDPYTSHGHDGILSQDGTVNNDLTTEVLVAQSLLYAKNHVDAVAPSDMMDGRIKKIRDSFEHNGYHNTNIISYSAKYASHSYFGFRNAVKSDQNIGKQSKSSYQLDFHNSDEAMREIQLDIEEGADSIIIKPASSYLDIIYRAKASFNIPIIAYQVSGTYIMLCKMAELSQKHYLEHIYEDLISCKRAGSQAIITYAALEISDMLLK